MSSSLNVFNTSCNDVLSAETTSMVKERAIEGLGEKPVGRPVRAVPAVRSRSR